MDEMQDDDTLSPHDPNAEPHKIDPMPIANPDLIALITCVTKLAEARDHEPGKHIERIQYFCKKLAEELRKKPGYGEIIDDTFIKDIYVASPFHDIGKIAVPDAILFKPASLTPEEFEVIKTHTTIGMSYLREAVDQFPANSMLAMAADIAGYHHEKWDGSGYPQGRAGSDIPLAARIMAVADVYDALRTKRTYKDAYSDEISVQIIRNGRGRHFDPEVTQAFLTIKEELGSITDSMFQ